MHVPEHPQFGLAQHIPNIVNPLARKGRKGRPRVNWALEHATFIAVWDQRGNLIHDQREHATPVDEYMYWYYGITRRWIFTRVDPPITYMPRGHIERDMVFQN